MLLQPFLRSSSDMALFSSPVSSPSLSPLSTSPPISPPYMFSPVFSPSFPTPPYSTSNLKLPSLIVALLQKRVIPEAEALGSVGNKDGDVVLEGRAGVIRVVLSVLCLGLDSSDGVKFLGSPTQGDDVFGGFSPMENRKPLVEWAVGLLCQWHKAGDDLPWRSVLEKTLLQIVS